MTLIIAWILLSHVGASWWEYAFFFLLWLFHLAAHSK